MQWCSSSADCTLISYDTPTNIVYTDVQPRTTYIPVSSKWCISNACLMLL